MRRKVVKPPVDLNKVLRNAKRIAAGYPEDCKELIKIERYIKELEEKVEQNKY